MPKMLIDGAVEYEDGTPATEAQVGFYFSVSFALPMGLRTFEVYEYFMGYMAQSSILLWCRWGKMWCHFCHGQQNQKWKRGSWCVLL